MNSLFRDVCAYEIIRRTVILLLLPRQCIVSAERVFYAGKCFFSLCGFHSIDVRYYYYFYFFSPLGTTNFDTYSAEKLIETNRNFTRIWYDETNGIQCWYIAFVFPLIDITVGCGGMPGIKRIRQSRRKGWKEIGRSDSRQRRWKEANETRCLGWRIRWLWRWLGRTPWLGRSSCPPSPRKNHCKREENPSTISGRETCTWKYRVEY